MEAADRSSPLAPDTVERVGQEDVALVRHLIEHLSTTGELSRESYAPDVVYIPSPDTPGGSRRRALEGLEQALASVREVWAEMTIDIQQLEEVAHGVVVASLRFKLRGHSGVALDDDQAWTYWVSDGAVTRMEQHRTPLDARRAARRGPA